MGTSQKGREYNRGPSEVKKVSPPEPGDPMFRADPTSPDQARLDSLRDDLLLRATETERIGPWESGAFSLLASSGLLAGFVPTEHGGTGAAEEGILEALSAVASGCLTTALVLTQWASACRIVATGPDDLRHRLLPRLARGEETTTVGIAQLTTSRQHVGKPALSATRRSESWWLDGTCPWVTGADSSDSIVTGAVTPDGTPAFFFVPMSSPGLSIGPPMRMLALSGSRTSSVTFDGVEPAVAILPSGSPAARAGGLATTALAIGATRGSIAILGREAAARPHLAAVAEGFRSEADRLAGELRDLARAESPTAAARDGLRTSANSLVVRAAQAALTASKGAGFLAGHPAERGIREAMLFLVWSCPQQVAAAVMCELAHLDGPA